MSVFRSEKKINYTRISNSVFMDRNLSLKAAGVLCHMLSLPDDWKYSAEGLAKLVKDGVDSVKSALKELEKAGYLVRKHPRLPNGRLGPIEYDIYEEPFSADNGANEPEMEYPSRVFPKMVSPPEKEQAQLNNKVLKTSLSKEMDDMIDRAKKYYELITANIGYDYLVEKYGAERIDEIVGIIVDTLVSDDPVCRIECTDIARELVRNRYLKLDESHIEYVMECMESSSTKIYNIKKYIQTALYNAVITIDSYYRAEINHNDAKRRRH